MNVTKKRVIAVVVTYQPDLDVLNTQLVALLPQVAAVIVVDNGSDTAHFPGVDPRITSQASLLPLERNFGIAKAQNEGVVWAREKGADFILLMDQDSIPAANMVAKLLAAVCERPDVAAVGPRYLDERQQNPPPFLRIKGLTLYRCPCENDDTVVRVDYLIASGCLISMSVLDVVGSFYEPLFIDYVDIEWGLRAKHKGLQNYGVCGAAMSHALGDVPIRFLGRVFPVRSPLRHYYMFRNAVWLYCQPWPPLQWKLVDGWRLLLKFIFYSSFAIPRFRHFRMMSLGIWHGLRGRMGGLDESH